MKWSDLTKRIDLSDSVKDYLLKLQTIWALPVPGRIVEDSNTLTLYWSRNMIVKQWYGDDVSLEITKTTGTIKLSGAKIYFALGFDTGSIYDKESRKDIAKNIRRMLDLGDV
jgi:hypothetical protein